MTPFCCFPLIVYRLTLSRANQRSWWCGPRFQVVTAAPWLQRMQGAVCLRFLSWPSTPAGTKQHRLTARRGRWVGATLVTCCIGRRQCFFAGFWGINCWRWFVEGLLVLVAVFFIFRIMCCTFSLREVVTIDAGLLWVVYWFAVATEGAKYHASYDIPCIIHTCLLVGTFTAIWYSLFRWYDRPFFFLWKHECDRLSLSLSVLLKTVGLCIGNDVYGVVGRYILYPISYLVTDMRTKIFLGVPWIEQWHTGMIHRID